jgi:hypothetical protein
VGSESDDELDDQPDWMTQSDADEPAGGRLRAYQVSLMGLFVLTTAAGIYFFLETKDEGLFALHALAGVALVVGLAVPALWVAAWLARALSDSTSLVATSLAVLAIIAIVVFCLTRFPGF